MSNNLKNSEDYLISITDKKSGFSAPKNYFDDVEERFFNSILEEKFPKKAAFKTPVNYFESLEDTILTKVLSPKKEVKVISLPKRILKYVAVSAVASVFLFIGFKSFLSSSTNEVTFDDLADNDIENWMLENSSTITTQDIAMVITDKELIENDFTFTTIDDDALEDYIRSNDNSLILNEIN
jgi:hypothetical protein